MLLKYCPKLLRIIPKYILYNYVSIYYTLYTINSKIPVFIYNKEKCFQLNYETNALITQDYLTLIIIHFKAD